MARIDFAFGAPDRLRMACEVVRKHYLAGRELVVYTQDGSLLARFDRLLWAFDPTAFVPHVYADDPLAEQTPVLLTASSPAWAAQHRLAPWLINLDAQCPPDVAQFERVLEIVSSDSDEVHAARERWRQYKTLGHSLHAHDVSAQAIKP